MTSHWLYISVSASTRFAGSNITYIWATKGLGLARVSGLLAQVQGNHASLAYSGHMILHGFKSGLMEFVFFVNYTSQKVAPIRPLGTFCTTAKSLIRDINAVFTHPSDSSHDGSINL